MDSSDRGLVLRLHRIEHVMRVFCSALVLIVGGFSLQLALSAPRFRQIFEDMLGSADELPGLTKFVLSLAQSPFVFAGIPIAIMVVGVVASAQLPKPIFLTIYGCCILSLIAFWMSVRYSLYLPVFKIFQGISGGP